MALELFVADVKNGDGKKANDGGGTRGTSRT